MTTPAQGPNPGLHLEPEELMAYVLELLSPAERAQAEAHLRGVAGEAACTECLGNLAAVHQDLGAYALAVVPMEDVPAASRDRLLQAIRQEPRSGAAGLVEESAAPRAPMAPMAPVAPMALVQGGKPALTQTRGAAARGALAWLGWGVAAAVSIAALHYYQNREALRTTLSSETAQNAQLSADEARARQVVDALTDRTAQRVTLTLTKAPAPVQPTGRATYLPNKGTLIFIASHMAPLPAGKTYELWVIPANGKAPVPAGTFQPDEHGSAAVVTAQLEPGLAAKAFGVTIEAAGGATAPTPPILLAGS